MEPPMSVFVIEDSLYDSEEEERNNTNNNTIEPSTPPVPSNYQEDEKTTLLLNTANRSIGTCAFIGALFLGCCCCCAKDYKAAVVESYDRHTVFGWFCPIEHVARQQKK